jgi:hypothetical protein
LQGEIEFFDGGREVALGARDACEFAVGVPLIRAILDVGLEDGEGFVLSLLSLEAATVRM